MSRTTRRAVLAGAGALAATAAAAQPAPPPPPAAAPARPRVLFDTAAGPFVIELADDKAPVTCANFLRYVEAKKYDGGAFYRAVKVLTDPLMGLVQGGMNDSPAARFAPIAHESTRQTGLAHVDGAVSMTRNAPGTATSEFFVCVGNQPSLDADPTLPGDNQGYAVFAHVVDGMDTVRKILTSPVNPDKGADWGMKGQILDPSIKIASAKRT